MSTDRAAAARHPAGEQPLVVYGKERSVIADTFAGRVHVEWEKGEGAAMTPLGQLPFFIEYLKQGGLLDGWVAGCPLSLTSPNAPSKRDILGTVMLSVLAGHRRYAHITTLRCDPVNPPLLGMAKVVSEDAVRRALSQIEAEAGRSWLQEQLDYCTRPLLREPWILDVDTTVKPLYGHQEGAVVGYNPKKPGRPSHTYHSYILANLRLVLEVEVQAGNQHAAKHSAPGLWTLLDRLGPQCAPLLLPRARDWGDCENSFDELKNHWGWGGFTTHDLTRCRIMARIVALIFNWWNLFVRLADPDHHREAITSRPLLLQAIGRQTNHAGRATVTISSSHGKRDRARRALTRIAAFFATLRETAEQLTDLDRWYRILSHDLVND